MYYRYSLEALASHIQESHLSQKQSHLDTRHPEAWHRELQLDWLTETRKKQINLHVCPLRLG